MPQPLLLDQPSLPGFCRITEAVDVLAEASNPVERGAVFTRREVVEFILDLVGYTADQPLHTRRLLEPSFGGGDFLLCVVDRLLEARRNALAAGHRVASLGGCIRAVELHRESFEGTRDQVVEKLIRDGLTGCEATTLADTWLVPGDFLMAPLQTGFDVVVGNPPYVRQELIPAVLLREYRRRFATLYDRADLYVPFIEHSLQLLGDGGQLGFICADRWMKNRYGGPLRRLISRQYRLKIYVDMVDTPAFHSNVIAYPAITVIAREKPGPTRVAARPRIEVDALRALARILTAACTSPDVRELEDVVAGDEPWLLGASNQQDLIRRIEADFPLLEEVGCKVGIGVATGADKAYIGPFDELDVEPGRKLPLAMTRDILSGRVEWRGYGVVNPFADDGSLVPLNEYPRLEKYFEERKPEIVGRHVARKSPAGWYRTIDRITPSLARVPKLLIPDIKGKAQVVFEDGQLYPHHNLYYVVSESWDLRALQAVLLSDLTRFFIATYSTKMRGGFLRFQAQYLRRIRLPRWEDVSSPLREKMANAAISLDIAACNDAAAELYGLTARERSVLSNSH